jgi:hypothetical protein
MFVRLTGKDKIFADGALRHRGDTWDAKRQWKYTDPVDRADPEAKKPEVKLNRKQVMHELAAAGVSFKATVPTEELEALLADHKAKVAPAASSAPSKEMQSSGDLDVI